MRRKCFWWPICSTAMKRGLKSCAQKSWSLPRRQTSNSKLARLSISFSSVRATEVNFLKPLNPRALQTRDLFLDKLVLLHSAMTLSTSLRTKSCPRSWMRWARRKRSFAKTSFTRSTILDPTTAWWLASKRSATKTKTLGWTASFRNSGSAGVTQTA